MTILKYKKKSITTVGTHRIKEHTRHNTTEKKRQHLAKKKKTKMIDAKDNHPSRSQFFKL